MKVFKHYKLKPNFSIVKDGKTKDRAGVGVNFGRSVNPNLTQFLYFIQFYLFSDLIQFEPILSDLNQIFNLDEFWSNLNQFELIWSNLNQFELIWSKLNWFEPICTNLNQFDPIWSNLNQFGPILSDLNQIINRINLFLFWSNLNQFCQA